MFNIQVNSHITRLYNMINDLYVIVNNNNYNSNRLNRNSININEYPGVYYNHGHSHNHGHNLFNNPNSLFNNQNDFINGLPSFNNINYMNNRSRSRSRSHRHDSDFILRPASSTSSNTNLRNNNTPTTTTTTTARTSATIPIMLETLFNIPLTNEDEDTTENGLDLNTLNNNTTIFNYTREDGEDTEICAICQLAFENNVIIRKINVCNHKFHLLCVDKWLEKNKNCPMCRSNIENNETANNNENNSDNN